MNFDFYIGIDYSGANTADSRLPGLQVYSASINSLPIVVKPPNAQGNNWTRKEIANWLVSQVHEGKSFIAGIDHNFSFPKAYLNRYRLTSWDDFLVDFCLHWPTQMSGVTVEQLRENNARKGSHNELRLTEKWSSSAKSVFLFDVQGQVAKSAHAGIPWLYYIRQEVGSSVHFWPFDGFNIEDGKSVIAEVYPSIFSKRYEREGRNADEHDAYSIARWLSDRHHKQKLQYYLKPPLPNSERTVALKEGWILGVC